MSANGEKSHSVPEIIKEKTVKNGKLKDLKSNFDNSKDSTDKGSEHLEESIPSPEDIIDTFFCIVDNERKELQIIEKNLSESIQMLEMSLQENLDTQESVNILRELIEQGMVLLREIKNGLSDRESKEETMRLLLAKFRESLSLKDSGASADGLNSNLVKSERGSFTSATITDSEELDETSDEDLGEKRRMQVEFVKTIQKAAKIRQKMAETEDPDEKEESN